MQEVANEIRAGFGLPPLDPPDLRTGFQRRDAAPDLLAALVPGLVAALHDPETDPDDRAEIRRVLDRLGVDE